MYSTSYTVAIAAMLAVYLLLDTITGTTSTVPEPRFYGLLMAGMLGLAGVYARKRQGAEQTTSAI